MRFVDVNRNLAGKLRISLLLGALMPKLPVAMRYLLAYRYPLTGARRSRSDAGSGFRTQPFALSACTSAKSIDV
jgi:hypothetical protein